MVGDPPLREEIESPMFVVSKKDLGVRNGKWRQITHSSWINPELGTSVNDLLNWSQRTVSYTAFDKMVRMFRLIGRGGWLFKIDFEKAYRMLPMHPMDWPFLGIRAGGKHLLDTRLMFGAGEAPSEFSSFADCLKWDMQAHLGLKWLEHYLDDFVGGAQSEKSARLALDTALTELGILGVCVNMSRVELAQHLVVLGIEVDMENMTVSVPGKKVDSLCSMIDRLCAEEGKKGMSLAELRTLSGLIGSCAMVVRQGRMYTQEIHDVLALAESTRKGVRVLPPAMLAELRWWKDVLMHGGGTQMMMDDVLSPLEHSPSRTPRQSGVWAAGGRTKAGSISGQRRRSAWWIGALTRRAASRSAR